MSLAGPLRHFAAARQLCRFRSKADNNSGRSQSRIYAYTHTLQVLAKNIDYEMRETFELALVFGQKTVEALGLDTERAAAVQEFVRTRDLDRLALQQAEGLAAGVDLLRTRMVHEPFSEPSREVEALNPEAKEIIAREAAETVGRVS